MKDHACSDSLNNGKDAVIGKIDVHMQGDLKHIPLPSLMSFLEMAQMSGSLRLEAHEIVDVFYFKRGRVVDVESIQSERSLQKVLKELVEWNSGSFQFTCFAVDREDRIHIPTSMILIDCARRQDEEQMDFESDELNEFFGEEFEEDCSDYEAEIEITPAKDEIRISDKKTFQISPRMGIGKAWSVFIDNHQDPISTSSTRFTHSQCRRLSGRRSSACSRPRDVLQKQYHSTHLNGYTRSTFTRSSAEIDTEIAWKYGQYRALEHLGVINSSRAPPGNF